MYTQRELTFFTCYIIQWKEFQVFNILFLGKFLLQKPLANKICQLGLDIIKYSLVMASTACHSLKAILFFCIKKSTNFLIFFLAGQAAQDENYISQPPLG